MSKCGRFGAAFWVAFVSRMFHVTSISTLMKLSILVGTLSSDMCRNLLPALVMICHSGRLRSGYIGSLKMNIFETAKKLSKLIIAPLVCTFLWPCIKYKRFSNIGWGLSICKGFLFQWTCARHCYDCTHIGKKRSQRPQPAMIVWSSMPLLGSKRVRTSNQRPL